MATYKHATVPSAGERIGYTVCERRRHPVANPRRDSAEFHFEENRGQRTRLGAQGRCSIEPHRPHRDVLAHQQVLGTRPQLPAAPEMAKPQPSKQVQPSRQPTPGEPTAHGPLV